MIRHDKTVGQDCQIIYLDPAKDFNITRIMCPGDERVPEGPGSGKLKNKGIGREETFDYERINGAWFPVRRVARNFDKAVENPRKAQPSSHYVITVKEKTVNEPVDDNEFKLKGLGVTGRSNMMVFDAARGDFRSAGEFKED